jgi:hypothetical protein
MCTKNLDHVNVLPDNIIRQVRDVIFLCNKWHWEATMAATPEYEPSGKEIQAAKKIVDDLQKVILDLKQLVGLKIYNNAFNRDTGNIGAG